MINITKIISKTYLGKGIYMKNELNDGKLCYLPCETCGRSDDKSKKKSLEQSLKTIIKDDVISDFRKIYAQWTDTEVYDEVEKRYIAILKHLYLNIKSILSSKITLDMITRKCRYVNCNRTWEIKSDDDPYIYCSIECACYDGAFSVTKGWLIEPNTIKGIINDPRKPNPQNT